MSRREHGGNSDQAAARFGYDARDMLDLSTGISPRAYPAADVAAQSWNQLPSQSQLDTCLAAAQNAYDVPKELGIMAGAGLFTFFLLSNIKNLDPKRFKLEDDGMFKKLALFMVGFLSILGCIITYSATGFIVFIAVTAVMVIVPTLFSYRLFKNGNQIK